MTIKCLFREVVGETNLEGIKTSGLPPPRIYKPVNFITIKIKDLISYNRKLYVSKDLGNDWMSNSFQGVFMYMS